MIDKKNPAPKRLPAPLEAVLAPGHRVLFTQNNAKRNDWGTVSGPPEFVRQVDGRYEVHVPVSWDHVDSREPVLTPLPLLRLFGDASAASSVGSTS